jgi:hypothetical protein
MVFRGSYRLANPAIPTKANTISTFPDFNIHSLMTYRQARCNMIKSTLEQQKILSNFSLHSSKNAYALPLIRRTWRSIPAELSSRAGLGMPSRDITIPDCVELKERPQTYDQLLVLESKAAADPLFFLTIRALFQFKNLHIVYASVMQMQIPEVTDSRLPNHNIK